MPWILIKHILYISDAVYEDGTGNTSVFPYFLFIVPMFVKEVNEKCRSYGGHPATKDVESLPKKCFGYDIYEWMLNFI